MIHQYMSIIIESGRRKTGLNTNPIVNDYNIVNFQEFINLVEDYLLVGLRLEVPNNNYRLPRQLAIRFVIIPNYQSNYLKFDKIILGEKYYLDDFNTIKKFRIPITPMYISYICSLGNIKTLEYLLNTNKIVEYDTDALHVASSKGHVDVLTWWLKSGLELKYTKSPLWHACCIKHMHVLEWWKNSGLPMSYPISLITSECYRLWVKKNQSTLKIY